MTREKSLSSTSLLTPMSARFNRHAMWRLSFQSPVSSTCSATVEAAPVVFKQTSSSIGSCESVRNGKSVTKPLKRPEILVPVNPVSSFKSKGLEAYNLLSKRCSKNEYEGLSGFLEYRKLNGTWRQFLFQTSGQQLMLYRIRSTHQVLVMCTDLHCASEISLDDDGREDTRLLRLGINGTTIILRAVTHRAAVYWVNGLQRIRDGIPLYTHIDPPCTESEEKIFDEIDRMLFLREYSPPSPSATLCGLSLSAREPEHSTRVCSTAGMLVNAEAFNKEASAGCKIC